MSDSALHKRDSGADVLHLDMDCFFAAVEVLEHPELAGKPVVVGGTSERGVVAAASYEARVFGIHAAMPTEEARRRCPSAVFVRGRFDRYGEISRDLGRMCCEVTPLVEPIALDECYLNVAGAHTIHGSSFQIGHELRDRVARELALQCSVGIGSTKLIAKLASRAAKPIADKAGPIPGKGVVLIPADKELEFLHAHPVRAVPGIGRKSAERFRQLGIRTVGEMAEIGRNRLIAMFGRSQGEMLDDVSRGKDLRQVEPDREVKSIGREETFARDEFDPDVLSRRLRDLAAIVGDRLRAAEVSGRTVSLKIRFADFSSLSRARTVGSPIDSQAEITAIARELLAEIDVSAGVRLIGVQVAGLISNGVAKAEQLDLFASDDDGEPPGREVDVVLDEIRERFGKSSIHTLGVVEQGGPKQPQPGGW